MKTLIRPTTDDARNKANEVIVVLPSVRAPNAAEEARKREIARLCEADRAILMAAQPFTARLLMQLNIVPVIDDRLPSACTDGESIFLNADFIAARPTADRRFILAHEVWHCALGHHRRRLGRAAERWNVACDHEVNALLKAEFGHCPADALYSPRYQGLSAEQIYRSLPAGLPKKRCQRLDEHDACALLHRCATVQDPDFKPCPVSAENVDGWQRRFAAAAQQQERNQGNLPGHLDQLVRRLRSARTPWPQLLAHYLYQCSGGSRQWLPPSRRHISRGLYLPSCRSRVLEIAVAIDASGSCVDDLPRFLGELKDILGAFERVELEILEFDTRVTQRIKLHEGELYRLDDWRCRGGGGSDICALMEALVLQPPRLLLALTDGYISVPPRAPDYPVIWCLTADGRKPAAWGEEVRLAQ